MSEQANAMTKQGFDQHNLLHLQWPQNCCLCRAETNLAALRAENEGLVRQTTADAEMLAYRKNEVAAAVRIIQGKDARIAELEAALEAADAMGIAVNDWLEEKVRRENYKMEVGNTPPVDFLERAKVLNAELSRTYADWVIAAAALEGDTSEIRRRASPDDKHPEDRIVH